ncbi:MAG: inorganic phosphate transporter [Bacteroidetes bacterium]|nr:inorganic phosphate transporter [Bacteroidota bacterium]MBT3748559.1 inorganic phosphate transporter [Bacteroidota bacterium]MBT4398191.1 inorganic phosphate transporter [Bacteroidota bacterium]MBT4409450.1 inorganic phosphate transporter [Bacteroidota bacterium]MBT7462580.1 inorganic phosphate transporter [Bacteroidota bacterium]
METFYIFIIVILFLLAISDLIVGVSNDAVNFLNSAIGSNAAPFRAIMVVAAAGIIVGATFSSGMMEVARKGIMHPDQFYFSEIMMIFLAVMMTDIILLDLYNTLGLPTSTTVSIVFELLGASVALSIIKMKHLGQSFAEIGQYINSEKALAIISGILISVIIAFSVGAIVQFLSRLLFSFNYQKSYKRFGAMFGGLAISAITFFMLIKGAKGSSFITPDTLVWIKANTPKIILISFFGWTIILQVLMWISKINIFKLIVIVGTFSLAMAFAGNDLVNFIGVPLAGFESFKTFLADPLAQPDTLLMTALQGKVKTPTIFLLIAGLIMVVTLWTSRKAKSVTKTTLDLSRQGEGDERFNSTGIARVIVRQSRKATSLINYVLPNKFIKAIENRFEPLAQGQGTAAVSFDLVRASVNLVVAAILIAIGTSLKLPLSTTYVTFMVAMGSSLADKAWGRESAVYRITGVMTVVAGWFVTAFFAFSAAFLIALFLNWAGLFAIIVMVLITALLAFRTHIQHKRKNLDTDLDTEFSNQIEDDILNSCKNNVVSGLDNVSILYSSVINGLITEDRKQLKKVVKDITVVNLHAKALKDNIPKTLGKLPAESIDTGHFYIQELDYLREVAHCLNFIGKPAYKHVDNNHKPLISSQAVDLMHLSDQLQAYIEKILHIVNSNSFDHLDEIIHAQQEILDLTDQYRKKQLKRLKSEEVGTRNSMLIIGLLHETRNLTLHLINLAKSHRDFILSQSN